MRTLWMWIASATAIGLCQRVQAKSDLLPSDNIPSGTKEATKPSLEAHNVPANFSAVFTCKHPDATNKTVSWLHNMAKIMDTTQDKKTRYNVTTEPGTSTFTIAHVQVEDQGSVMCQVQSGAGLVENTVTFKVSQFEIKVNQQDVTGETTYVPDRTTGVTYTCAIKYVPKNAHLSWFHNGTELNATTCKNRKCIIENDNVPADVKKAVVYYPAVKSAPSDGMQCKLVAPNLVFGDGGHAQQSGAIKLVTYGTPKFSDSNVTNQRIQVHSGQLSTVVCMDSVDAKHTSKLLLYIGKAMVAESFSGPDNKPLNVAYQFVPHRDNNTALVECKSINRIYGEMSNSSAKLPLRVIYGPEKASVLVTAPSVSPPNETFAAYCHAGKNNPLIKFTWSIHPLRGRGSSYNHTDCSEKGANSWIGGAISHASIMVTPAHGDKEVNITCVVTNPTSDVTVAATAIVQVKVESANTAGNIVVIVVGAVVAGVLALILLMVWVICRKTGRC